MKQSLWFLAFLCLCGAAATATGIYIQALKPEWFSATIFFIAGMFSAVEFATKE